MESTRNLVLQTGRREPVAQRVLEVPRALGERVGKQEQQAKVEPPAREASVVPGEQRVRREPGVPREQQAAEGPQGRGAPGVRAVQEGTGCPIQQEMPIKSRVYNPISGQTPTKSPATTPGASP